MALVCLAIDMSAHSIVNLCTCLLFSFLLEETGVAAVAKRSEIFLELVVVLSKLPNMQEAGTSR